MQQAEAFGLSLELEPELRAAGLRPFGTHSMRPPTVVRIASPDTLENEPGAERVRETRHPDGELLLSVDREESGNYLIDAPYHGRVRVEADGLAVACAPLDPADLRWQTLLHGQALPLAATLRGLELFHAAGAARGGQASLFSAASGVGKSTLLTGLLERGAELVSDDVVAVEVVDGVPLAHPGPALVHLDPEGWERVRRGGGRLTEVSGYRSTKLALESPVTAEPTPLRAMYLLERDDRADAPRVEPVEDEGTLLLGATFVHIVRDEQRLRRHLDLCARVARTVPVFRLLVPSGASEEAADLVWSRL